MLVKSVLRYVPSGTPGKSIYSASVKSNQYLIFDILENI